MTELLNSKKELNPRTMLTEVNTDRAIAKKPLKLVRQYKKSKCSKCETTSYYMPQYSKVICPKCMKIPIMEQEDLDKVLPISFLTKEAREKITYVDTDKSQYNVIYPSPEYYSDKNFPGRNEPCVCGSGKKFKKCCMRKLEETTDKIVVESRENNKNATIVSIANTVKLFNLIHRTFSKNEELVEVPMEDIKCIHFADIDGKLEDPEIDAKNITIEDPDIVPVEADAKAKTAPTE